MRFGTGGTLEQYFENTTPRERIAWQDHFRHYPPGDFLTQNLLARLCSLVASFCSGSYVHPKEFAPWIKWKADFAAIEKAESKTIMNGLEQIMVAKESRGDDG